MSDQIPTHYKLDSCMEIDGVVRTPGTIITAEQFEKLKPEAQEMLLTDAHLVPCDAPVAPVKATPPSPFPRKTTKAKTE